MPSGSGASRSEAGCMLGGKLILIHYIVQQFTTVSKGNEGGDASLCIEEGRCALEMFNKRVDMPGILIMFINTSASVSFPLA